MKSISIGYFLIGLCNLTQIAWAQSSLVLPNEAQISHLLETLGPEAAIDSLNELAWEMLTQDQAREAIPLAQASARQAIRESYLQGCGDAYSRIGAAWQKLDQFDSAAYYHQKSLRYRVILSDSGSVGNSCLNLGAAYAHLGNFDLAEDFLKRAENRFSSMPMMRAILNQAWGEYYDLQEQLDSALIRYQLSLDSLQKWDAGTGQFAGNLALLHYDKALIYAKLSDWEEAFSQLNIAARMDATGALHSRILLQKGNLFLGQQQVDSARFYYNTFLAQAPSFPQNAQAAIAHNNLGLIAFRQGNNPNAIHHFQQSSMIWTQIGNPSQALDPLYNLGLVMEANQDFPQAILYYRRAYHLADSLALSPDLAQISRDLAATFFKMGQGDSAFLYQKKYQEIHTETLNAKLKASEMIRMYERREQKQLLELTQYQKRQTIGIAVGGIGILFLITLLLAYITQTQHRQILQKKLLLQEVEQEQIMHLASAHSDGILIERTRLSQELHDRLGSLLTLTKIHVDSLHKEIEEMKHEWVDAIDQTRALLDQAYKDLRAISHDLGDQNLKSYGLVWSLNQYKAELEGNSHLSVELDVPGLNQRLPFQLEFQLSLIVRELVQNVLKHAKARSVLIQIVRIPEGLNLSIEDDGIGYDQLKVKAGMGLNNISHRVKKLGGQMDIDSTPGIGTTVLIEIPAPPSLTS